MRSKLSLFLVVLVALLLSAAPGTEAKADSAFRALNGAEASAFNLPADVVPVRSFTLANGLTYERYQQLYGPARARVFGGQLTVYRQADGQPAAVIGAHYRTIRASNNVRLTAAQARQRAAADLGPAGERLVNLLIDPHSGRYFYAVETRRPDSRWIHWINAGTGQIMQKFDALASACDNVSAPCGFGVEYDVTDTDVKDLTGLTTPGGNGYLLLSSDGRQETHDQGSTNRPFLGPVASDADNSWVLLGNESPAQQALVDGHYYANLTDDYLLDNHGYDWVAEAAAAGANDRMEIHAHYSRDYNNAFWSGTYLVLGDGDQVSFEELTGLDVVAHELTHGITDFTSNLIYQDESGALNEAFSDIVGSSAEFYADANSLEPATTISPDWFIGEDFDLRGDSVPGFRNMADPTEDGDPSHYADRYTGTSDNGGVHTNSGIANHWYYLLVNGGQNAAANRASGTDVAGIGLSDAEQIAFMGFTALTENATYCDARASTIAVGGAQQSNVADAWDEVGVDDALCNGGNASPTADFTFSTTNLTVDFSDQSSDTDGFITNWEWDFGDGNTATSQNSSHTYAAGGTYAVTLTVTDDAGATDSLSQDVTVSDGSSGGITLTATGYKVRGLQTVDLAWSGATSGNVDIVRDGVTIATIANNNGSYTDNIGQRGGGSYTYEVCEADTTTCSPETTVNF